MKFEITMRMKYEYEPGTPPPVNDQLQQFENNILFSRLESPLLNHYPGMLQRLISNEVRLVLTQVLTFYIVLNLHRTEKQSN